jgi:predicted RNase H-related nuclease YkuK (DUF458 family)
MKKVMEQQRKAIHEGWQKVSYGKEKIADLETYIYNFLATRDDIHITIGTDALLTVKGGNKKLVEYLTVICFHMGKNGTHIIGRIEREVMYGHVSTARKLDGEVNRTSELALWMRDTIKIDPEVHLDVNPDESYDSFQVYKYIHGYFESLGFSTEYKPYAAAAMCAADYYLGKI